MNIEIPADTRASFRDWLRKQLKKREFYNRRGNRYLIREFHKYYIKVGHPIDEASLGRYLRDENPVVPTPARCRELGAVLKISPIEVMKQAGLVFDEDFTVVG